MVSQLPLGITLPEHITFANFLTGNNEDNVNVLKEFCMHKSAEKNLFLWGQPGAGRTHLLQAACQLAAEQEFTTSYIPLKQFEKLSPELLNDMHTLQLIAVDDVAVIAGNTEWEYALFRLYQRALETQSKVIWSADAPPSRLRIKLKDLQSRLASCLILHLQPLTDTEKLQALQQRANERGLDLPDSVGQYLLSHCPRHLQELFAILDKLDHAALVAQRALTIPFVKAVLNL